MALACKNTILRCKGKKMVVKTKVDPAVSPSDFLTLLGGGRSLIADKAIGGPPLQALMFLQSML